MNTEWNEILKKVIKVSFSELFNCRLRPRSGFSKKNLGGEGQRKGGCSSQSKHKYSSYSTQLEIQIITQILKLCGKALINKRY